MQTDRIVLTPDESDETYLTSSAFIEYIFSIEDELERQRVKGRYLLRAKELRIKSIVNDNLRVGESEYKKYYASKPKKPDEHFTLIKNEKGKNADLVENFLTVLTKDEKFKNVKYNSFSGIPEVFKDGVATPWTDSLDSEARRYIELHYSIYNQKKADDAFRVFLTGREYHPVKNMIEALEWDGVDRIESLFVKWLKVEDSDYSREVTRLIFSGGINRIYKPGCKFDDVCVLVGTSQGEGKSTFIRWLAMEDQFFSEVEEFEGQKGIESIEGSWICEIAEMLATTKAKEVESVKSFLTKQSDKYRKPYDRRVSEIPRQNIFIGSTNKERFLTDMTGNRRFYPLKVNSTGYDLFENETEIKRDIKQCWAEALAKKDTEFMKPFAKHSLLESVRSRQMDSMEDDYRIGLILEYIRDKEEICIIELWKEALHNEFVKPTRKDSNDISLILQNFKEWERQTPVRRFHKYGHQKYWKRITETITNDNSGEFEQDFDDFTR